MDDSEKEAADSLSDPLLVRHASGNGCAPPFPDELASTCLYARQWTILSSKVAKWPRGGSVKQFDSLPAAMQARREKDHKLRSAALSGTRITNPRVRYPNVNLYLLLSTQRRGAYRFPEGLHSMRFVRSSSYLVPSMSSWTCSV